MLILILSMRYIPDIWSDQPEIFAFTNESELIMLENKEHKCSNVKESKEILVK